jgi:hypothetical protein
MPSSVEPKQVEIEDHKQRLVVLAMLTGIVLLVLVPYILINFSVEIVTSSTGRALFQMPQIAWIAVAWLVGAFIALPIGMVAAIRQGDPVGHLFVILGILLCLAWLLFSGFVRRQWLAGLAPIAILFMFGKPLMYFHWYAELRRNFKNYVQGNQTDT